MASPDPLPTPGSLPSPIAPVYTGSPQTDQLIGWLSSSWLWFFVVAVCVFVIWRFARPFVHRGVVGVLEAQGRAMPTGSPVDEIAKRAATLEDLVNRLIRFALVLAVVFVIFGLFDLWPAIAGLGIVLAALTLAGQSVILDYIMGILILVEGQYFVGDTVRVGDIEGVVEEVGFRRTVLRDPNGVVHSVSNGTIRVSSNLTRIYAVAMVDLEGVRNRDVEAVIGVMDQVGRELADDPAWSGLIVEAPGYRSTLAFTDLGVTLRMSAKVRTQGRWSVPAELRRRLALGLTAAHIHLNRRIGVRADGGVPGGAEAPDVTGGAEAPDVTGTGSDCPRT
ncbi:MAG: mechanosensitive ion channel family protein [Chloroflexi bacterium]|nr:mechanosensitive ion channel family protein [Chloroflexota bacterium]